MKTIDILDLDMVCGGLTRNQLVMDKLQSRYGWQGGVSFIGEPHYGRTHDGVSHVTGKFDTNAQWGGDTKRTFSANVDWGHQNVTGLRTRIFQAQ